jgi:hypothetical protein
MDYVKDEKSTMATLVIEAPEAGLAMLRFPPGDGKRELRKALALALIQHQGLSCGNGRMLAQMTRWEEAGFCMRMTGRDQGLCYNSAWERTPTTL